MQDAQKNRGFVRSLWFLLPKADEGLGFKVSGFRV